MNCLIFVNVYKHTVLKKIFHISSYFKIKKKNFENVQKIKKIQMNSEKLQNSFEIKKGWVT